MRLKELRIKKKLSQSQLGKILGVSGQTILNWENGIYEPSINNLILLANYFNVTIDYIVGRNSTTNPIIEDIIKYISSKITN